MPMTRLGFDDLINRVPVFSRSVAWDSRAAPKVTDIRDHPSYRETRLAIRAQRGTVMKIKLILENASGLLAESEPVEVLDETDVGEEARMIVENELWALAVGDSIRIVEAA